MLARDLVGSSCPSAMARDNRWLQVEVCRDYLRGDCSRSNDDCKYAHPPEHVDVNNDKVVSCYDHLKGQCTRAKCKYLHPSRRIKKEQLDNAGRTHGHHQNGDANYPATRSSLISPSIPQLAMEPTIDPGFANRSNAATPVQQPVAVNGVRPPPGGRRPDGSDRMEACREFLRGACRRPATECRFAHPGPQVQFDPNDNSVTVCMDFIKDRCMRRSPPCKYHHPPPHLQQRVRHQQQQHQATLSSAGAAVTAATTGYIPAHVNAAPLPLPIVRGPAAPQGRQAYDRLSMITNGMEKIDLSAAGPPPAHPHIMPAGMAPPPAFDPFLAQAQQVGQAGVRPLQPVQVLPHRHNVAAARPIAGAPGAGPATNGFPVAPPPPGATVSNGRVSMNIPTAAFGAAPLDTDGLASAVSIGVARQQAQSHVQFETQHMHSSPWNDEEALFRAQPAWAAAGGPPRGMPLHAAAIAGAEWVPHEQLVYDTDATVQNGHNGM
eukprot:scpid34676/ scgid28712/ Muscleblind-like protein 2 &gt; Muscleblind-like protein 2